MTVTIANQLMGRERCEFPSKNRPRRDGIVGWAETDTHVVMVFDHDATFTAWARDRIKAQKISLSTPSLKELVHDMRTFGFVIVLWALFANALIARLAFWTVFATVLVLASINLFLTFPV